MAVKSFSDDMRTFGGFIAKFKKLEPLSNFQISDICKALKIKHFKGVFMRDELKQTSSNECLILNIDRSSNMGTHWTCLFIKKGLPIYFDSFGFPPPLEVIKYCSGKKLYYSTFKIQANDEVICGHYCIYMLFKLSNGCDFYEILDELYRKIITNI
jgi:hypothetical protein